MRARILQFARRRYAGFHDLELCAKLDGLAASRRPGFRRPECSNSKDSLNRFPVAKSLLRLSRY